jgi:iron complex outermembrane receptor protein
MPALPSWLRRAAALSSLVALALPALAQTAAVPASAASQPEVTLPAVRAVGSAEREAATGPVQGYAAKRSATATKTDTPLNEVPKSISVIGAEQLRDQASPNLQEALRYTAGVRTETYGVDNRGDWFSLRGGSNGSTLIDGLRRPPTGWWGIVRSEPYAFERIEVLRGPASVIAGQNGPGGVVNLVSKRPQAERAGEIGLQLGSDDHKQVQADLTGPIDAEGKLLYRLVALGKSSGTQVDHAFDDRELLAPSLTWRPNAGTLLTVFAQYQRDESGNLNAFFPASGTLLPAPNGPIPMETFIGEPDWDTYGGKRWSLGWHLEQRLGEDWTLRHSLRSAKTDGVMRTMYAAWWDGFVDATGTPDPNGTYLNRFFYASDDRDRVTNADLLFEGKLRTGAAAHTLLLGMDGFRSRAGQRYYGEFPATPLDVYHPVYGSFPLPALPDTPEVITTARRLGLLVQDQIKLDDRWVLVASLRRDKSRTAIEGGDSQTDSATTKNLGAVWLADGGWSPYVGYSESFDPVSGSDAAGALFKPTRGRQIEAGVKWQPAERRITASAAVYQLRETNRLVADPDNPGFSIQRGEVTVKGLELELAGRIAAWELSTQYSYTDAQISRTSDADTRYRGQQLEAIPKHSAGLWAVHRFAALPGLRAGVGLRHVGKSSDGVGSVDVPAVDLLDAMLAYELRDWRLALNANNLTDKKYVASCLERGDCWFGQRRRVVASASYRF